MSNNTGGPAFTFSVEFPKEEGKGTMYSDGMTLRDYFAAKAMSGMCFSTLFPQKGEIEKIVKLSYEMADAMLKAREK